METFSCGTTVHSLVLKCSLLCQQSLMWSGNAPCRWHLALNTLLYCWQPGDLSLYSVCLQYLMIEIRDTEFLQLRPSTKRPHICSLSYCILEEVNKPVGMPSHCLSHWMTLLNLRPLRIVHRCATCTYANDHTPSDTADTDILCCKDLKHHQSMVRIYLERFSPSIVVQSSPIFL